MWWCKEIYLVLSFCREQIDASDKWHGWAASGHTTRDRRVSWSCAGTISVWLSQCYQSSGTPQPKQPVSGIGTCPGRAASWSFIGRAAPSNIDFTSNVSTYAAAKPGKYIGSSVNKISKDSWCLQQYQNEADGNAGKSCSCVQLIFEIRLLVWMVMDNPCTMIWLHESACVSAKFPMYYYRPVDNRVYASLPKRAPYKCVSCPVHRSYLRIWSFAVFVQFL